jgi:DNA-binding LytR/AlgR family response regulator
MKITIEFLKQSENDLDATVEQGETELIIRCKKNPEDQQALPVDVRELLEYLDHKNFKLSGTQDGATYPLNPEDIYYFEYVDGKTFAYTKDQVYKIPQSLDYMEKILKHKAFFRCSKGMILNLKRVLRFQSVMGNRIIALMENKEEVVVSRHYAKMLRASLKED